MKKKTIKTVENWIRKGKGKGEGSNYIPFIRVRDFGSRGRSSKPMGLITGRTHQLFSDNEYNHLIWYEYNRFDDIREQYPLLPHIETQDIARLLSVKHPVYPGTNIPIVMTSDIVLTKVKRESKSIQVVSIKYYDEIDPDNSKNARTLEKLKIEEIYWNLRKIKWTLSTERDLPLTKIKNLDAFRHTLLASELNWLIPYLPIFSKAFMKLWNDSRSLNNLLNNIAAVIDLDLDYVFNLFGRSIWLNLIPVDLDYKIKHESPVKLSGQVWTS